MKAWIGLGSNIDDGSLQLDRALALMSSHACIKLIRQSGYYLTAPWGECAQEDFTNAVAEVETDLQPLELLDFLLATELKMGRIRTHRQWEPRIIDLDLLSCGDLVLSLPALELPHPRMHLRAFVLQPLLELEPAFKIPGKGSAQQWLASLEEQRVERI